MLFTLAWQTRRLDDTGKHRETQGNKERNREKQGEKGKGKKKQGNIHAKQGYTWIHLLF
jgi:hypothetical protein